MVEAQSLEGTAVPGRDSCGIGMFPEIWVRKVVDCSDVYSARRRGQTLESLEWRTGSDMTKAGCWDPSFSEGRFGRCGDQPEVRHSGRI